MYMYTSYTVQYMYTSYTVQYTGIQNQKLLKRENRLKRWK